jgi:hypothetical protein
MKSKKKMKVLKIYVLKKMGMYKSLIRKLIKSGNLNSFISRLIKNKKSFTDTTWSFMINFMKDVLKHGKSGLEEILLSLTLSPTLSSTHSPTVRSHKKNKDIILSFLTSLSLDPTYIMLDNNFSIEKNKSNYDMLVAYLDGKAKDLRSQLSLSPISLYSFFVMDDDFIPFYNSIEENTYDLYVKRKIEFIDKSCYLNILRVLNSDITTSSQEKKGLFHTLTVCKKIGQGAGTLLTELGEQLESGNPAAIAGVIVLIIAVIVALFLAYAAFYYGFIVTEGTYIDTVKYLLKRIIEYFF